MTHFQRQNDAEGAGELHRKELSSIARLSYSEKLRLTNRDALLAVAALIFVVLVWLVCGFGLSGLDVRVFHLPVWVVGGLLGTWAAAIVAAVVLSRLFKDFELDAEADAEAFAKSGADPATDSDAEVHDE